MLKSWLLTACRTLIRNKEYSFINIGGMAVSIASCLILFSVIRYELSFDTFHKNRNRIYRVTTEVRDSEGMNYGPGIPAPLPDALRLDFPQLEEVATIFSVPNSQIDVLDEQRKEEVKFREERGVFYAEPQFFRTFDFGWLYGSPDALLEANTVVLTQETAERYFGNWRNAIGKVIEYNNRLILKVSGILRNVQTTTDFPLKVVISFKTRGQEDQLWGSSSSRRQCYILLDEHTSAEQIETLLPAFVKKHHPTDSQISLNYALQPLKDVHFDGRYGNFNGRTAGRTTLLSLGMIGVLLIITASTNFINMAIAQVMKRSKEVGVRKVLGSNRWQLSGQFFGETFLIMTAASFLAVVLSQAALPMVRSLLNLPSFYGPDTLQITLFVGLIIIVVTTFSGWYPARVLGTFNPVHALKSKVSNQTVGGIPLKKGLVVIQFAIAQILIIATLIVFQQIDFFRSAPLGFDKNSIILLPVPTDSSSQTRIESFRNRLLQESEIENVSFSNTAPLSRSNRRLGFRFNNSAEDAPFEVNVKYTDAEYFKTYDLYFVAGRPYQSSEFAREYVVNETFLKKFGILNPADGLGKAITINGMSLSIVGVVKDFHNLSLKDEIEPLVMMCTKDEYNDAGIKFQTESPDGVIKKIESAYRAFFPDNVFEYRFFDDNVAQQYAQEEQLFFIVKISTGMAILISSLGLYGLISFMVVQRTKEVGIRKVLGASVRDIILLFYKEFLWLVLIAFVVSAPSTGYFMSGWLNTFAYKINLSPWVFILAIAGSIIISMLTVSFRSITAAIANPVDSLRTE